MDQSQTFKEFLASYAIHVPAGEFVVDMLLCAVLSFAVQRFYVRYGTALSNRERFGRNFIPIGITTMFIIRVVKSSLALSLGLVGALSVIRFRTAIKDPEELSYLFLIIGIGLGLGANQREITVIACTVMLALLYVQNRCKDRSRGSTLLVTVGTKNPTALDAQSIATVLKEYCSTVALKRLDSSNMSLEAIFLVKFDGFEALTKAKAELEERDKEIALSYAAYD